MKKELILLIYPLWYFLTCTWIGVVLVTMPIMVCSGPWFLMSIIMEFFPDFLKQPDIKEITVGLSIVGLPLSVPIFLVVGSFGEYLERNYYRYGYKVSTTFYHKRMMRDMEKADEQDEQRSKIEMRRLLDPELF